MSDVDRLVENTPLDMVLQHYGLPLSDLKSREYRMMCVFNDACGDTQYGNLSIRLDAAKRIYCHACQTAGNLLTLLHGLETKRPPNGSKLRGQEFKDAVQKLRDINGFVDSPASQTDWAGEKGMGQPSSTWKPATLPSVRGDEATVRPSFNINTPLHRHEKEAAKALADLYRDLVTDVARMSPEAAAFVRKREHWLTPDLMRKWGCGWIPGNGRSLFRKNYFVYTHRNTRGDIVSYSGRDLNFESKWDAWIKAGKPEGKKTNKHRYVSGFKRGAELYGGFASRLEESHVKESLRKHGLVVVEGMNDVMRLDEFGVCAVGLCSNRATDQQVEMLERFANEIAGGRIALFPDTDEEGKVGFKELLWSLNERKLAVSLAASLDENVRQPEDLQYWVE